MSNTKPKFTPGGGGVRMRHNKNVIVEIGKCGVSVRLKCGRLISYSLHNWDCSKTAKENRTEYLKGKWGRWLRLLLRVSPSIVVIKNGKLIFEK